MRLTHPQIRWTIPRNQSKENRYQELNREAETEEKVLAAFTILEGECVLQLRGVRGSAGPNIQVYDKCLNK